ncbi:PH domain-containing protein [Streptomyces sp. NPDC056222]|uniref:PH domain-containing protein n=1 Tax=Streptomyces sp. NPDC056222 TaxID=3345749 RepID=UPI0035DF63E0
MTEDWRRLDRRTVLVTATVLAGVAGGAALPVFFGLTGSMPAWKALGWIGAGAALLIGAGAAADHVRWRRTRYRIGAERSEMGVPPAEGWGRSETGVPPAEGWGRSETGVPPAEGWGRVELHTGLLLVKRRSLSRERIRTVDLTANPLLRVLGLVKVRIGTGESAGGGESTLELDPVARAEGERLRRELLARTVSAAEDTTHDGALAELDRRWIRYAPVSFVAPLLGGAAAGAVMQVSEWFGAQAKVINWIGDRFEDTSVLSMIIVLVLLATLAGTVGALGLWVEMWWNYRLEREPGGTLRVRRGLFTARSISVEERRLRGVELVEPLGVRMCRAARVDAVATGLVENEEDEHADHKTLLPPAPRAVADRVAAQVLREPEPPTSAPLTVHPRAARTRRLRWALAGALVPAAVLAVLGAVLTPVLLYIAAACALVSTPLAVLLALDAYRNLGHGITGGYLVARSGTIRRTTVALQRGGVIGWTVKQSYFQRRAGVLTLTATTAAGAGAYDVHDAGESEGLAFAAEAVPELLAPFLEPVRETPKARSTVR